MMKNLLKRFRDDESGATAIEYGLIAALIALTIITGAGFLGNTLNDQFNAIGQQLTESLPGEAEQ